MHRTRWASRWITKLTSVILTAYLSANAQAAGITSMTVPASGTEAALQAIIWTPCAKAAGTVQMGIVTVQGVRDCAVERGGLPLIVISHGKGGSSLGHHDTATALADAGFVVVTVNHPGDSYGDETGSGSLAIFESRPRDISRLISFMTQHWQHRQQLKGGEVGVFGFSRGGYTTLSLIGAVPDVAAGAERFCSAGPFLNTSMCRQLKSDGVHIRAMPDPRVRAAVVVDPLNLFGASSFKAVRVPVQLWASEAGGDGVEFSHIAAIQSKLPQAPDFHVARGAGHFAYLAPCPPILMQSAKEICSDPKGFDRAGWHQKMNADVVSFFQKNLSAGAGASDK